MAEEFGAKNLTIAQGDRKSSAVETKYNGDVDVTYTDSGADMWSYNAKLKLDGSVFKIDGETKDYINKGNNTHIFASHVEAGTYRDEYDGSSKKDTVGGFFDGRNSTTFGKVTSQSNFTYNGGATSAKQGQMSAPVYIDKDAKKESRSSEITQIYKIGDYNVLGARDQL